MEFGAKHLEQLPPKCAGESWITITDDVFGQPPILHDVLEEEVGSFLGIASRRGRHECGVLREPVNHNHNSAIPVRLRQGSDEVHGDAFPRTTGDRQWLQESAYAPLLDLVLLANEADLHVALDVFAHLRPKVGGLNECASPPLSRMTRL